MKYPVTCMGCGKVNEFEAGTLVIEKRKWFRKVTEVYGPCCVARILEALGKK